MIGTLRKSLSKSIKRVAALFSCNRALKIDAPSRLAVASPCPVGKRFQPEPMNRCIDGGLILPPGAYAAIYTLTSVSGLFSFDWEEVPL